MKRVANQYGEAPGEHLTTRKDGSGHIVIPHLRFGNVVILPQPAAAYGRNESKLVHGVKRVPPHSYIASYLWVKHGFKADALMHFGTHGSLEFTPWKQNGLSGYDWPDALTFDLPHVYIYLIQNIGEAVHAKRRSYAVLVSHLTPPYMETGIYGEFAVLGEKLHAYGSLEEDEKVLRAEYRKTLKKLISEMKLDVDLGIKGLEAKDLDDDEIRKIHHYVDAVETEKVTSGYYVIGRPYSEEQVVNTARLMAIEPISYSLARLDIVKGLAEESVLDEPHEFQYYRDIAFSIIDDVLLNDADPLKYLLPEDMEKAENWTQRNQRITMAELMSGNRRRGGGGGGRPGKRPENSPVEEDLVDLVVGIAADPSKKEIILGYQNTSTFERASSLLDQGTRKKAQRMARFIPAMKKAMEITLQEDMLTLIGKMQNKKVKQQVFELLSDPDIRKTIAASRQKKEEQLIHQLTADEDVRELTLAMDSQRLTAGVENWSIQRCLQFKGSIGQYQKNTEMADRFAQRGTKNATAVSAILLCNLRINCEIWSLITDFLKWVNIKPTSGLKSDSAMAQLDHAMEITDKRIKAVNDGDREFARNVNTLKEALLFIRDSYEGLKESTDRELSAVVRALSAGYIEPSPAGDAIHTPKAVPTGRNLYAIDAEITPTEESWRVGQQLAQAIIEQKLKTTRRIS